MEFAFIALPFFALLFAIVQVSLMLLVNSALDTALTDVARSIWARETQNAAPSFAQVKTAVCAGVPMLNCDELRIEVSANADAADVNPAAYDAKCFDPDLEPPATCYDPGAARDVLVLRAAYKWPFGIGITDFGSGSMLVSTAVFKNEIF
ncbi:TadE/TadG family type IV pilus assembly protein [Terrihabitans rhizophilus]|uniref:TadE/TadG family type IV pilus assembly protein n=1 Tax=Terrihabitans rhizophilus TaxID=3092662 RepID=A0ABU4RI53_9HYPH|nr:TadE/TadG family type IV pilus assembly protein [Terrihabitans sp. PJ23]MDX6804514.1 TadE/TadG family type IV pilus assembly protein [Terrihabitans sp. PJ23]